MSERSELCFFFFLLAGSSACSPWSFNVMMGYTEPGVGEMWEQLSSKLLLCSIRDVGPWHLSWVNPASSRPVCPWASRVQEGFLLLMGPLLFSPVFLAGTSWSSEPLNYFSSVFSQLFNCCWIVKKRAQVWGMLKSNSCPNSTLPSCSTFWEVGWAAPLRNLIY